MLSIASMMAYDRDICTIVHEDASAEHFKVIRDLEIRRAKIMDLTKLGLNEGLHFFN